MSAGPRSSVAIIGSGIGGICLALDLKNKGFQDFVIYERDNDVGGTWNNNAYPGCRCDVDVLLYSHSCHPKSDWQESHPERGDIHQYWKEIAERNGILPHVKFAHTLISASWDASASIYRVELETSKDSKVVLHQIVVSAVGGFSTPLVPPIPGLNEYQGQIFHTANWPKGLVVDDLESKQVVVVGNGCSGVQLVTALAANPRIRVVAMARSHHWILPSPDPCKPASTRFSRFRKFLHRLPAVLWLLRFGSFVHYELIWLLIRPGAARLRRIVGKKYATRMRDLAPPALKDVIVPPFDIGAKRFVVDGGYLAALNKSNVVPIWEHLASATETSILTESGQTFSPDLVVLATGFDVAKGLLVYGRDGKCLPKTGQYHGTTVPGFPNFFQLLGANVSPGHHSVIFSLEVQANYVSDCIVQMRRAGAKIVEIKQSCTEDYNRWLDTRLDKMVWNQAKHYYRADGGRGKVFTHFPGPQCLFWWQNRKVNWDDYIGGEAMASTSSWGGREAFAILFGALVTSWVFWTGL